MNPTPTGTILRTTDGYDLVVRREFQAPIEDVWESVTNPERTARWYGPWRGDARPGGDIQVQMLFEEGAPWCDMHIQACEPPRRLVLTQPDPVMGDWHLELVLSQSGGTTTLHFFHHLTTTQHVGAVGPGWEYYLDMLVSSRDGTALPDFNDYYPSQQEYYEELVRNR